MKLITVIVRPTAVARLASALRRARVSGLTVSKVEGFGSEHLAADVDLFGRLNPRAKIEVAVNPDELQPIVAMVKEALAKPGKDSGGMVFISDLDEAIRVPRSP